MTIKIYSRNNLYSSLNLRKLSKVNKRENIEENIRFVLKLNCVINI